MIHHNFFYLPMPLLPLPLHLRNEGQISKTGHLSLYTGCHFSSWERMDTLHNIKRSSWHLTTYLIFREPPFKTFLSLEHYLAKSWAPILITKLCKSVNQLSIIKYSQWRKQLNLYQLPEALLWFARVPHTTLAPGILIFEKSLVESGKS